MVSHLTPESQTHWLTGTSAPCTGIFKPVWIDSGLPDLGPTPTGEYNPASLWWRHEDLHRSVLLDFPSRLGSYRSERDALEDEFIRRAMQIRSGPVVERAAFSADCFTRAAEGTARWTAQVQNMPIQKRNPIYFDMAWGRTNKRAQMP